MIVIVLDVQAHWRNFHYFLLIQKILALHQVNYFLNYLIIKKGCCCENCECGVNTLAEATSDSIELTDFSSSTSSSDQRISFNVDGNSIHPSFLFYRHDLCLLCQHNRKLHFQFNPRHFQHHRQPSLYKSRHYLQSSTFTQC